MSNINFISGFRVSSQHHAAVCSERAGEHPKIGYWNSYCNYIIILPLYIFTYDLH